MKSPCLWTLLRNCIILLAIVGCRKSLEPAAWDVDVLAPIAKGDLSLQDVIKPPVGVSADSTGALLLHFEEELVSIGIDSLFDIPDTAIVVDVPEDGKLIPIALPFLIPIDTLEEIGFNLKEVQLTEAIVRDSKITVKLRNPLNYGIVFTYLIPSATLNGLPFSISASIPAKETVTKEFDLNGHHLDLRGRNNNSFNKLVTRYVIEKDPSIAQEVNIPAFTQFSITTEIEKIIPQYAKGFFGDQRFDYTGSDSLGLFGNIPAGTFQIGAYNLELEITNGVGIDLKMDINSLSSSNTQTAQSSPLTGAFSGQSVFLNRAIHVGKEDSPVIEARRTLVFTESNSNLSDLIGIRPNLFTYDLALHINPLGNISLGNDFVYYGHDLGIKLKAEVPLQIGLNALVLQDTVALDFDREDNKQLELLNQGEIRVYVQNLYPVETALQVYLLAPNGTVTDSIFASRQTIAAAIPVGKKVQEPVESTIAAPLSQEKITRLDLADRLVIKSWLHTNQEISPVTIYEDYQIHVSIVADLNVRTRK